MLCDPVRLTEIKSADRKRGNGEIVRQPALFKMRGVSHKEGWRSFLTVISTTYVKIYLFWYHLIKTVFFRVAT
jgi:hypothetical protein